MLSKEEVEILKYLDLHNLNSPMNSKTIKVLSQTIDLENLNYYRLRAMINHLVSLEYVKKGYREKRSNTFFISEKGKKIIKMQI